VAETANELTTIEQTVRIAASPTTVWQFWTDPKLVVEWFGAAADVEPEPGGLYRVVMEAGQVMRGAVVELGPPRRLVFTFGWEGNPPGEPLAPGTTNVEVTLEPDEQGTVLTLRHTAMPVTHAPDHRKGWAHLVGERLVAAAEATAGAPT